MSALLTLCVVLLPLATPGRGARQWEPCTGEWGRGCRWGWGGPGVWRGAGRPSSGHRAELAVGTAALGREEAEIKGSSKPCAHNSNASRVGTPFKDLAAPTRGPSQVPTCWASREGLTPAGGMRPGSWQVRHLPRTENQGCTLSSAQSWWPQSLEMQNE